MDGVLTSVHACLLKVGQRGGASEILQPPRQPITSESSCTAYLAIICTISIDPDHAGENSDFAVKSTSATRCL
jgi:hypothetical protein